MSRDVDSRDRFDVCATCGRGVGSPTSPVFGLAGQRACASCITLKLLAAEPTGPLARIIPFVFAAVREGVPADQRMHGRAILDSAVSRIVELAEADAVRAWHSQKFDGAPPEGHVLESLDAAVQALAYIAERLDVTAKRRREPDPPRTHARTISRTREGV